MSSTLTRVLALIRVAPDEPAPTEAAAREALAAERRSLGLSPAGAAVSVLINGPYPVGSDGERRNEFVVWER